MQLYNITLDLTSVNKYLGLKYFVSSVNLGHIPVNTVEGTAYIRKKQLFDAASQIKLCLSTSSIIVQDGNYQHMRKNMELQVSRRFHDVA